MAWPVAFVYLRHDRYGLTLLDVAVVLVAARAAGALFHRLRQPPVIGEVLAGIALGPSVFGDWSHDLFPAQVLPLLRVLATVGLVVFMFFVGLELDVRLFSDERRRVAAGVALSGTVVPFAFGMVLALALHPSHHQADLWPFSLFIGAAMSITAFPVLARILVERELFDTPLGGVTMAAAAGDDVLTWATLSLVVAVATSSGAEELPYVCGVAIVFAVAMVKLARPLLERFADRPFDATALVLTVVGIFVSSFVTATIGMHEIFGAFLFGCVFPRGRLAGEARRLLDPVVLLLLPVFFVVTGLGVDLAGVGLQGLWQLALILAVACAGKLLGALAGARSQGLALRESVAVGVLMNTRGLTELVALNIGREIGVVDERLFTLLVVMAVVTTVATGPLLDVIGPDSSLGRSATGDGGEPAPPEPRPLASRAMAVSERPTYVPPELPDSMPRRNRRGPEREPEVAALRTTRAPAAAPVRPRIVSSAHGPLRHVMLWYPPETGSFRPYRAAYGDLLRLLPATTRVTMVVHPESLADAEALADGAVGDVELVSTPDWLGFSVWAEDACVVVEDVAADPPVTYLVEPFEFLRAGDQIVADLVAEATTLQSTQLPLIFQGGNVLIGDDFVLIGRDYLDESVAKAVEIGHIEGFPERGSRAAQESFVRDLFRRTFDLDRDVHFLESDPRRRVGDSVVEEDGRIIFDEVETGRGPRQPIFHIDMFVSLAGRDPATGRYRVLVGDPRLADQLLDWTPVAHDMAGEFDDIADQLGRLGFSVQRTPLPYVPAIDERPGRVQLPDGTTARFDARRRWYHATSNNCLVQIDGDERDVWLPTYGHGAQRALEVSDRSHRRTWEQLGFTVHQLGDFNAFAYNLGALHCIKKYLAR